MRKAISRRPRGRRPSLGLVLAVVALLAALGGTAVAGGGFLTKKKFKNQAVQGPVVYATSSATLPTVGPGNSYVTVTATCPPGTRVIGGGAKVIDPTATGDAYQNDSYETTTGWTAHVSNYTAAETTATAIAVCVTAKSSTGSPPAS